MRQITTDIGVENDCINKKIIFENEEGEEEGDDPMGCNLGTHISTQRSQDED